MYVAGRVKSSRAFVSKTRPPVLVIFTFASGGASRRSGSPMVLESGSLRETLTRRIDEASAGKADDAPISLAARAGEVASSMILPAPVRRATNAAPPSFQRI